MPARPTGEVGTVKEDLCLQLGRVVALVRERIVTWRGYRGQGRRAEFVENVCKLALYVAKYQRRNPSAFPCCRMALQKRIDVPEHVIRSAIRCLVEIRVLDHDSPLTRKIRSPRYAPRQFRLGEAVRAIFAPTRQEYTQEPKREIQHGRVESRPSLVLAGCVTKVASTARDLAKAAFRATVSWMSDEAFERAWSATPDAGPRPRNL